MSDEIDIDKPPGGPAPALPRRRRLSLRRRRERPPRPRVKKLRLLLILIGLSFLAFISTVFGMMMAVASDLPQIENRAQYRNEANSYLYDDQGAPLGLLAPPNNVVLVQSNEIAQSMKDAIISIEDRRFYSNSGVDIRGIARAFISDISGGGPRQGASTIEEQFVKNALAAQSDRTVFEKLREAALAYHLARKWRKDKILTEYLNSIYFGNGAYGIESAARVYFGAAHGFDRSLAPDQQTGCGDSTPSQPRPKCASVLAPWESAMLAAVVASPTAYDPLQHPVAARRRRNLVLLNMLQQHYITRAQYGQGVAAPIPTSVQRPDEPTAAPYFTSWLRPQIIAALSRVMSPSQANYCAYYGGLKIKTSLDLQMQKAAQQAIEGELPPGSGLPTASLVAIDNHTGEVRAMVGGSDYASSPFNLATEGYRQPGSSFKPFTLAMALASGEYGPDSVIDSAPQNFIVPNSAGKEHFIVHNFGNTYSGPISLAAATAISDNSVYSQVGIHVGTRRIARLARVMGIRSPISANYAMILGGLKVGVTPLDMAHAYETFATGGRKVFNPIMGASHEGPIGIDQINNGSTDAACGKAAMSNRPTYKQVLPGPVARTVHDILTGVVSSGTGTQAAIPGVDVVGKTGTTSNYADAWFVGWTPEITTAVWVGFPDKLVSMATDYNGGPVEGGTYPAVIWRSFVEQALQIIASEKAAKASANGTSTTTTDTTGGSGGSGDTGSSTSTNGGGAGSTPTPTTGGGTGGGTAGGGAGAGQGGTGGGGGGGSAGGGGAGTGGGAGGGGATGAGGGTGGGGTGGGGGGTGGGTPTPTGGGTAGGGGTGGGGSAGGGGGSGSGSGGSGGAGVG